MDGLPKKPRLRVRTLLIAIAVAAVPLGIWSEYLSPARQWRKALRADRHTDEGHRLFFDGVKGKVPGLSRDVVIAELFDGLNDARVAVRWRSILGFLTMTPREDLAVASIAGLAQRDPEVAVRSIAALALGVIFEKSADTPLRALGKSALVADLNDRSDAVRAAAAGSLLQMGEDDLAFPTLNKILGGRGTSGDDDSASAAYHHALQALRGVGQRARPAIPALLQFVGDFSRSGPRRARGQYRRSAADLLLKLGERKATLEVLENALQTQDPVTRRSAQMLIRELGLATRPLPIAAVDQPPVPKPPVDSRQR